MLQDFVVETADDADDDDENDDDDYESCGSLPLFSIFLCCNGIVPQKRRKKIKNNNLKILNIENMYTIINKVNFVFHTAYESTNHCKNR